jgi:gliding motility-associated-like protein
VLDDADVSNGMTGVTYSWVATSNLDVSGEGSGTGNITEVLNNVTGSSQTVTYVITPTGSNVCIGNTFNYVVTVNPEPLGIAGTVTTCSDVALSIVLDDADVSNGMTGVTYSWVATSNLDVSGEGSGTGNITDVLTNVTGVDQTVTYVITPTGSTGCIGNTFNYVVTVKPEPVGIVGTSSTCSDVALSITLDDADVSNGMTGVSYSWVANNNTNVGGEGSGTGNITEVLNNVTGEDQTVTYVITPTGSNACFGNTFDYVVTVKPEPVVLDQTAQVCSGVALNLNLDALIPGMGDIYTYTVSSTNETDVPAGPDRPIASASSITDIYSNSSGFNVIVTYDIIPLGSNGCAGDAFDYDVTVNQIPTIDPVADQTVCFGFGSSPLALTATPPNTLFDYENLDSGDPVSNLISGSGVTIIPGASVTPNSYVDEDLIEITPVNNGCVGEKIYHKIIVIPELIINPLTDDEFCTGSTYPGKNFSGNVSGMGFTWSHANPSIALNGTTDFPTGPNNNNQINSFPTNDFITYNDCLSASQQAVVEVTPTYTGCPNGTPVSFTITLKQTPSVTVSQLPNTVMNPGAQINVCDGVQWSGIGFSGNMDPCVSYNWTNNNTSIGLDDEGTGNIPGDALTNNGNEVQCGIFQVTASFNGCTSAPKSFEICVNEAPVLEAIPDQHICAGANFSDVNFNLTNGLSPVTYTITPFGSPIGISATTVNNSTSPSIVGSATPNNPSVLNILDGMIEVTPNFNGCSGSPQTFHIIVHPTPTVFPTADQGGCSGDMTSQVCFSGNQGSDATYTWTHLSIFDDIPDSPGIGCLASFELNGEQSETIIVTPSITTTHTDGISNTCIGSPDQFTITSVSILPTVTTLNTSYTYCNGDAINIPLNVQPAMTSGTTVSWNVIPSGSGGIDNGSPSDPANPAIVELAEGNILTIETANVFITPVYNGCAGDPHELTINVKKIPHVANLSDVEVCANVNVSSIPFTSLNGSNFNWTCDDPTIGTISLPISDNTPSIPSFNSNNTYLDSDLSYSDKVSNISVTPTLNGCTGASETFTITVKPAIQMTNLPSDIIVCSGEVVQQVCFNNDVPATYEWENGLTNLGMSSSNGNDCIPLWSSTSSGSTEITVTPVLNGCEGIPETFNITVVPKPVMNPLGPLEFCHNQLVSDINFTADIAASFEWNRTGDAIGSTNTGSNFIPSFTANNPSNPGVDLCAEFNVTPNYASNNLTCYGDQEIVKICIHPLPEVNAGNDTLLCIDQCFVLNATGNGYQSMEYTWNQGNQSQPFCPTATTTLTVTGIDGNSCQDTDQLVVNFVNEQPPIVYAGDDDEICLGESYTLNATGDIGVDYTWNNGVYSNGQTITPVLASQTDTFVVIGVASSSQCISIDTVLLLVNPLPLVSINSPSTSACQGESITLTANGATNYQWTDGPNTSIYEVSTTGTFEVIGYDNNNCSNTAQIDITINPLPIPIFSVDMNFGCPTFCPTFKNESENVVSAYWEFGNQIFSDELVSVTNCYDEVGCYDVKLTVTTAEGCSASLSQENYICVGEVVADFATDPLSASQSIFNPEFDFFNNSQNATNYEWYFGDGIAPPSAAQSILENPSYSYDDAGFFLVTLIATAQDGCADTIVKQLTVLDELIIHVPNSFTPDGDELNELFIPVLSSGYDRKSGYLFNIYNRWGEIIFTSDQVGEGWDGTFEGKQVPVGTYSWTIRIKDSMSTNVKNFNGHVNLIR